jgi:hypothetical protein
LTSLSVRLSVLASTFSYAPLQSATTVGETKWIQTKIAVNFVLTFETFLSETNTGHVYMLCIYMYNIWQTKTTLIVVVVLSFDVMFWLFCGKSSFIWKLAFPETNLIWYFMIEFIAFYNYFNDCSNLIQVTISVIAFSDSLLVWETMFSPLIHFQSSHYMI